MAPLQQGEISITYYTDPLCCWSWAFEKEWQQLKESFGSAATWHYCMGGLLPAWNNYHDAVNSISRPMQMGPMWMHAAEHAGIEIRHELWVKDPPASSYPACIAVKCASLQSRAAEEQYLLRLRKACMLEAKNIARAEVLYDIAEALQADASLGFQAQLFAHHLNSSQGRDAFRADLQEVKYRGINRFPALLVRSNNGRARLITGYHTFEHLQKLLEPVTGQRVSSPGSF